MTRMTLPRPDSLDSWHRWVEELEDHPLDLNEYGSMLLTRDGLAEELEVAGVEAYWAEADALDIRFVDVTIEAATSPLRQSDHVGWWWSRLPAHSDGREYLAVDFAASALSRGSDLGALAVRLRHDFELSPIAAAKVLWRVDVPLADAKTAVDATLTPIERATTEHLRNVAEQARESS